MSIHTSPTSLKRSLCGGMSAALILAGAATIGAVGAAGAADMPEVTVRGDIDYADRNGFRRTVRFADLDIGTEEGRRALRARVWEAASDGCREVYRDDPIRVVTAERPTCISVAFRAARRQMNRVIQMAEAGVPVDGQLALNIARGDDR